MKHIKKIVVFLFIYSLVGSPYIVVSNAKVEEYEADKYGDGGGIYRFRKKFGVLATNVKDVKVGVSNNFLSTQILVSQKANCYRQIDFSKKLEKKYTIRYKNTQYGRDLRDLVLTSPFHAIYRNSKGNVKEKGEEKLIPKKERKKIKKYWGNNTMLAYVADDVLTIKWDKYKKSKKYFRGSARQVKKVVAGNSIYGEENVFVLMEDGSVWGWGDNQYHLISNKSQKQYRKFIQIVPSGVKDISASQKSVAIHKKDDSLWVWGEYRKGKKKKYTATPKKIDSNVKMFSMSQNQRAEDDTTGSVVLVYVKKNDVAYGWGSNHGCGMTKAHGAKWIKKPVKLKKNIDRVYVANEVVLLLSKKDVLYWSGHIYGTSDF